jgi:inhibitor of cysteine peptidase
MKHEDLIKKLENLETPEIELISHKQALKMALLSSGRFKERTIMDWAKILAPVTAAVLLIAVMGLFAVYKPGPPGENQISRFASYEELQEFVNTNTQYKAFPGRGDVPAPSASLPSEEGASLAPSAPDYSTTNIQIAGVDEADIVKTDGEYIYLVSGERIIIVKAYPPEQTQVLSEIELEGTATGLFINGDRLVVFEEEMPYVSPTISIKVYDVLDRENPWLQRELSADGQYVSSRMIGDYAYVVINEPVYEQDDELNLPKIHSGGNETEIPATDIYYCDVYDYFYMYTTIMAINTQNDDQEPTYETILLGASSNLYVSLNNIYLTFPVWGTDIWGRENWDFQKSSIHRIHIEGDEIEYVASGEVPGMVLNQFSMDEYENYFRVATTTYERTPRNHIYTLDMDLNIVGSLEDLAPGETIYSARFMGERGYLVTFKQVDPLFVIDLSDPRYPEELGYLKVTGYSDYLHPYDANHLIGIGRETVEAEEGDFVWFEGVKISLLDVGDVNNPMEISKYEIGDIRTDSPVLWDHKALLFNKSRNLLVIPAMQNMVEKDESDYPEGVPQDAYGNFFWQGVYVFHISPEVGLRLEGTITHIKSSIDLKEGYYYYYCPFSIERSLYIGDVLYTISQVKIKMNSLENLDYINEVELPHSTWTPPDYPLEEPRVEEPPPVLNP